MSCNIIHGDTDLALKRSGTVFAGERFKSGVFATVSD